jgi:hypothetical protein
MDGRLARLRRVIADSLGKTEIDRAAPPRRAPSAPSSIRN